MDITNILFFIISILTLITSTSSTAVDCDYNNDTYKTPLGNLYRCYVTNDLNVTSSYSTIDIVNKIHATGMSNKNVNSFYAYKTNTRYFPKGLELIFKNLKRISIIDGPLQELTQENLEPFPELIELYLYNNDIQVLDDEVFAFNSKLALIHLHNNKLRGIGENVFVELKSLINLNLRHNPCIDKKAENDSTALESIMSHIHVHCNILDYIQMQKVIRRLEDSLVCTNSETLPVFQARFEEVRTQLGKSKYSDNLSLNNKLQKVFNITHQGLFTMKDQVNATASNIKALNDKITNLESLLSDSTGKASNKSENTERFMLTKIDKLEKSLTAKISNIERILRDYITADTRNMWNFQSNVNDRLKVQNYKIDNNSEIQGSTQSVLIASCAFLVSLVIYIAYKKFLYRMMMAEEKRNGI